MKNLNAKAILTPVLVLFLICLIVAGLLGGTNALTKDPIEEQTQHKAQQARKTVLPQAASFEQAALPDSDAQCYAALNEDDEILGYAITTAAKGYGGDVQVMTGIDAVEGNITGVSILSQSETPGLGANAVKPEFTGQYKQAIPEGGFNVIKNAQPQDGEIEAMTGATITSKAVTDAVNEALSLYTEHLTKGGNRAPRYTVAKELKEFARNEIIKQEMGGGN